MALVYQNGQVGKICIECERWQPVEHFRKWCQYQRGSRGCGSPSQPGSVAQTHRVSNVALHRELGRAVTKELSRLSGVVTS